MQRINMLPQGGPLPGMQQGIGRMQPAPMMQQAPQYQQPVAPSQPMPPLPPNPQMAGQAVGLLNRPQPGQQQMPPMGMRQGGY